MNPKEVQPEAPAEEIAPRRFIRVLLAVCVLGLLLRIAMLVEFLIRNPIARSPIVDGWVYWQMAGDIARGKILSDTPFLSAPLYPYLLGLLRGLGFGLTGVYILQVLGHVTSAWLVGCTARRCFDPRTGIAAAALFLLLADPAFDSTRILPSTLQVLLICLLTWRLVRARAGDALLDWAAAGVLLGLFCLAYPAALLLVAVLGAWVYWRSDGPLRKVAATSALVGSAAVIIAPATLHNWRATGGELIPITAHAGITFLQGNSPQARGVYHAVPGISSSRELMHYDAAAVYRRETGRPGSWREIDRYFRNRALRFWGHQPTRALLLIAKRIYLFFTARHYNEIHWPAIEARRGFGSLQILAPVPAPWLLGLAAWGLLALRTDLRKFGAEWAVFLLPLIVVAVFFYSPRYRMAALPGAAVMAAWVAARTLRPRAESPWAKPSPGWSAVAVGLLAAGLITGPANRLLRIDHPAEDHGGFDFNLGVCLARQGRTDQAIKHLKRALQANPTLSEARINLGLTLARKGLLDRAEAELRSVLETEPESWVARWRLAQVLAKQGRPHQAVAEYERLLEQRPDHAAGHYELGTLLEAGGQTRRAAECYRRAAKLAPQVLEYARSVERASSPPDRE